ncbi:MAG TPA: alkaline phosphatase [Burkholderiaceae bacterium]|nr:alkaline phosphatase [Burkholderiaceae bacterium]HMX09596.1 alkaline phosphatase [Burkholderiaceae bacterium]HMZ00246.1 alkaline phosphatase [Burkholderiaceae bacterium]HNB43457.1 alkaline phosphatase [Burkholderiaceae bacterium]HNG78378.1 alkaline phosphatase [Burkholderiaceae bacterium]
MKLRLIAAVAASAALAGCWTVGSSEPAATAAAPKNILFFLGDGMGMTTQTAARIYQVGEDGELTMDTLPETAFVKTYSNNAQVTDSAPSMAAYMTGVKMNNEVISMTPETSAFDATGKDYLSGSNSSCATDGSNGKSVTTLLELAKAAGLGTGAVTTTRVTHATPATTYAHVCHRDGENAIAAQVVPGGAGTGVNAYNSALGDGLDVLMGGGRQFFLPTAAGGKRSDGRDLTAEFKARGYTYVKNKTEFDAAAAASTSKLVGLFTSSHMSYDIDRDPTVEPSLAEMTTKAIDILAKNPKGFFLMVEGGRIDHALHETTARKALQDTVAFDAAIKTAIDAMQAKDPGLKNTLIVVTADHDHTLVLNGYAARKGKTTATEPGVLGLVKSFVDGVTASVDSGGLPFSIIGFGNGENRPATRTALTDAQVSDKTYHQEAAIPMAAGSETHGGADVFLGAIGKGAENFTGVIVNTEVFGLIRKATGL